LILDLVPNHSSNQHEWFAKSLKKEEPYSDYYVWAKPKNHAQVAAKGAKPEPPNNWVITSPTKKNKSTLNCDDLCHYFDLLDQRFWRVSLGIQRGEKGILLASIRQRAA
jgi:glycosidase